MSRGLQIKDIAKEVVEKFNMEEHYEILVDSTVDKDQPKTILRYKKEGKRSFRTDYRDSFSN